MTVALFEDFLEKTEKLAVHTSSTGGNTRIDGVGGLMEIASGGTSGQWRQLQSNNKIFEAKLSPVVTAFFRTKEATNLEVFVGLADTDAGSANNAIGFYRVDTASAGNWKCRTKSGGTGTDVDTGFLGDTQEVEMSFAVSPLEVTFVLNGRVIHVEKNNIPTAQLFLVVWIKTNTGAARTLVMDYVGIVSGR